jgi:hypothetical protein
MKTVTAKGTSNADAVIASASEAIHKAPGRAMDCFVASLLAMTEPNFRNQRSGLIDVDASAMIEL